jgi:phosphatidylethanolamine/phosphatidyl-N-methylethanolamine N-methyltransferase
MTIDARRATISKWFFLKQFLNRPRRVGSAWPSSQKLARAMIAKLGLHISDVVVELGPGTGVFTSEILRAGIAPENLVLIELNPQFAAYLQQQFPRVKIVVGDASQLPQILASLNIGKVKRIVSGIPFRSLPQSLGVDITKAIAQSLEVGGALVQFTYAAVPPLPTNEAVSLGLNGARVGRVLANFPPAVIWRYEKQN